MWSRGIAVLALGVTCASGALAAVPAAPRTASAASAQESLMRALELAPAAVAAWKRAHDQEHPAAAHRAGRAKGSKRRINSRIDPFGIKIFARS